MDALGHDRYNPPSADAGSIDDPMRAEGASGENERWLYSIFEHSKDIVTVVDAEGILRRASPALGRVLGHDPKEVIGTNLLDYVHPDDLPRILEETKKAIAEHKTTSTRVECRCRHVDGSWRWVESVGTRLLDDPAAGSVVVNSADVTERKQAEGRLRAAEERYRTLVEQIPAIIYIDRAKDGPDEPLYVSPQIEKMLGYTQDEWLRKKLWPDRLHPEDRERVLGAERRFESGKDERFAEEYRLFAKDGSLLWLREEAVTVRAEGGEPLLWQGVIFDVTERKGVEERLRALSNAAFEGIVITHQGEILEVNEAYAKMHGYEYSELIGKPLLDLVAPEYRERVQNNILAEYAEPYEVMELKKDGTLIDVEVRGRAYSYGGRTVRVTAVRDITERKAFEKRLAHQAFHDPLTGLPNRASFMDRLEHALARAERSGNDVAILFMDLDDFKVVNDSLGHEAGDKLLVDVSGRLRACLRSQDTLARFGGDEFAVVLEDMIAPRDVANIAERIAAEFRNPFEVAGRQVFASASIGITLDTPSRTGPEEMIRNADTAMYRAKRRGKADYQMFEPRMHVEAMRRLELEADLRRAIEEEEFELYYQPKVLLRTGKITGVEALLRWEHPQRGMESAAEVVSLAEETGLIAPLGRWVLREACRQAREWRTLYPSEPPMEVNVNLSARQFRDPGLAVQIRNVLAETRLDPSSLSLEITEGALMEDVLSTLGTLRWLKDLGVKLAIDDFGTGYSSLAYLKRFPIDAIKIDRSITSGIERDPANKAVASAATTLAHALGLEVVAEGIEKAEELIELQTLGCDLGQGYYFAKPLPEDSLGALLKKKLLP